VALSREVVDCLEVDVPAVAASVVQVVGAVTMLCVLSRWWVHSRSWRWRRSPCSRSAQATQVGLTVVAHLPRIVRSQ
jgi:hypothetical protein